jgi:hypothetical protein
MTETNASGTEPLGRWLDLMRAAFQTQVRLSAEYAEVARAAFKRDVNPAAVGRTYLQSSRREVEQYWRSIAGLWLNYASGALAAGSRASSAVLRDIGGAVQQPRHPAPDTARPAPGAHEPAAAGTAVRRLEVLLTGPLGAPVSGTVTIANNHADARRIVLKPGPWLDSDGNEVNLKVVVKPSTIRLAPGAQRTVSVTVDLDAALLSAGKRYESVVEMSGGEAELHLTVEPAPA